MPITERLKLYLSVSLCKTILAVSSSAILLNGATISVAVGPPSANLGPNQSQQFTAIVTGDNSGVSWLIIPAVGTISGAGLYTAPATISSSQSVKVIATSWGDVTKTATAVIVLTPPVSIPDTTSPTVSITGPLNGQNVAGNVSVSAVASDNVGVAGVQFLADGVAIGAELSAPPYIRTWNSSSVPNGTHVISAVARDAAGNRRTVAVSVTVSNAPPPVVSITLGPANTSLGAAKTQQFTATVTGTSNTGVSWSISPQVGTISSAGLYTAPAAITNAQDVTVTATSLADSTKKATAVVALTGIVSITLGPKSVVLTASQTQQFTATVSGSSNTGTSWSISPQVAGTISSAGLYTAPATISNAQNVTVVATSLADPTKTATALVALKPNSPASVVSVVVGPANASLNASQTQQFTATVTGSSNTGVTWSLSPTVGTISATGLYTAPASTSSSFTAQPVVTVTATSLADPTKTATATVTIVPTVSITVGPSTTSLTASQTKQFTATVVGSTNTGVSWSINPLVGSISSGGLYTAPRTITSAQNVMLTATSLADATKTAVAVISLTLFSSPLTINLTAPGNGSTVSGNVAISATAGPGGSVAGVRFYADSSPVAALVTSPPYTANWNSSSVSDGTHTLSAMAQDSNGNQTTTTISVSVANNPSVSSVTLPIEVMGAAGTTQTVQMNVPSVPAGTLRLWLQIHGLKYQTEASVQVNGSAWMPINDTTVTLLGLAKPYGGIGGGFSTLKLTMILPAGVVVAGTNTISFRFNGTDGVVSGFRVLALNFLAADGTGMLSSSAFVHEDPATWQPPSSLATDIAAGKLLWSTANLTTVGGPIRAKCADCHAQDGRDLKYFNYSNESIRVRSMFHGLSSQQGNQIASYVRSLNVPNPGRPWNPPYQPGPGLDGEPVESWAAGAGIDAVLDSDADMLRYIRIPGDFAATANLNVRETPLALQFPDWNRWLPVVHPMDAFGNAFLNSQYHTVYPTLRSSLGFQDAAKYLANSGSLANFAYQMLIFTNLYTDPSVNPVWTPDLAQKSYSARLWGMVKLWEINSEFGLEGMTSVVYPPGHDVRAWFSSAPFTVSPNQLHIPRGMGGLGAGDPYALNTYLSQVWYNVQLTLNHGNKIMTGQSPIDWGYVSGFIKDLNGYSNGTAQGMLYLFWQVKALQCSEENMGGSPDPGAPSVGGPERGTAGGWPMVVNDLSHQVNLSWRGIWNGMLPSTRASLMDASVRAWFNKIQQYSPQQFYTGEWASPLEVAVPGANDSGRQVDRMYYMIPLFRYFGVDATLMGQVVDWAKTLWPNNNWEVLKTVSCSFYPQTFNPPGFTKCDSEFFTLP